MPLCGSRKKGTLTEQQKWDYIVSGFSGLCAEVLELLSAILCDCYGFDTMFYNSSLTPTRTYRTSSAHLVSLASHTFGYGCWSSPALPYTLPILSRPSTSWHSTGSQAKCSLQYHSMSANGYLPSASYSPGLCWDTSSFEHHVSFAEAAWPRAISMTLPSTYRALEWGRTDVAGGGSWFSRS